MGKYNPTEENIRKCYEKVDPNEIKYKYPKKPIKRFNNETLEKDINEIKLWKIDRQVNIKKRQELCKALDNLGNKYNENKAKDALELLLDCDGIKLAVASAILNVFSNEVYPIFDKRAYRALKYLNNNECINYKESSDIDEQISTYKEYCKELEEYYSKLQKSNKIEFMVNENPEDLTLKNIDKYLYQYDVETGLKLDSKEDK